MQRVDPRVRFSDIQVCLRGLFHSRVGDVTRCVNGYPFYSFGHAIQGVHMSSRRTSRSIFVGLLLPVLLALLVPSPLCAQAQARMTRSDVEDLLKEVSNWGRWGKDDELGAINLITSEKRRDAARLVKEGVSVSMARRAEKHSAPDNPQPFEHKMLSYGKGTDAQWSADSYSVQYHGYAHTHMDSLCHLFHNDQLYNGFSRDVVTAEGATKLQILNLKNGIFTRGILVDIPRLRGVDFLEPGTPIYPAELEAWKTALEPKSNPAMLSSFEPEDGHEEIRSGRGLQKVRAPPASTHRVLVGYGNAMLRCSAAMPPVTFCRRVSLVFHTPCTYSYFTEWEYTFLTTAIWKRSGRRRNA